MRRPTIIRLATDLGEDTDLLLALARKVGSDLQAIILRRPKQFAGKRGLATALRTGGRIVFPVHPNDGSSTVRWVVPSMGASEHSNKLEG
jgi:hypothetical protein